jgi:hypothetical protein
MRARFRWRPTVRKRGQLVLWTRRTDRIPSTTTALRRTRLTAPAPRVVYQRRVSFKNQDPPETATAELEELVTGVVDDCSPDEVMVVEEDEDVVELLAVEVLAVPGIVWAPTAPSMPTPTSALTAAPVVSRLRRRMAASRARTLSWIVSSISMV